MTDATAPLAEEPREAFEVALTSIPLGVRCRSCGRQHLPARLWPVSIAARPTGGHEVILRCVRCLATGPLHLDTRRPDHQALLEIWRAQRPGENDTEAAHE